MATVNRNVIKLMLIRTELGGIESRAYYLSNLGSKFPESGYSFGQPQWDLANNAEGRTIFENILTNAKGSDNYLIFDTNKDGSLGDDENAVISDIMKTVAVKNGALTSAQIDFIESQESLMDAAVSSEYGKQEIDAKFETYVDYKIGRVDSMVAELRASGREQVADYIANNSLIQMMLIDYDNQLGIDGIDSIGNFTDENDGKLLEYLKDGETTINNGDIVEINGDFDIRDYLNFIFNTTQGFNSLEDVLRRLSEIAKTASENLIGGDMLTDLQKLLLEAKDKILDICDLLIRNREINNALSRYFTRATQWRPAGVDPLTLDLDGDGIETVGIKEAISSQLLAVSFKKK